MAFSKKKKKVVKKKSSSNSVEEVATQEAVESPSEEVQENSPKNFQAILLMSQTYQIGNVKFRRGVPVPIRDPELVKSLQTNSAFSVQEV